MVSVNINKYFANPELKNSTTIHDWADSIIENRCADPAIGTAILQNRNEFQQAPVVSSILGFLGSNVFMVSL